MLNRQETLDLNDPLVQVMLCGDGSGVIPRIGKIPAEFRGNRTKGDALREALRVRNFIQKYPGEANNFRMKVLNLRKGITNEVNTSSEQQLVGASA